MPTFQSIGMHPELHNRLVTESGGSTTASTTATVVQHQLVLTPQALLARNPNTLRLLDNVVVGVTNDRISSQKISLAQVQKLRVEVSSAMIAQSNNGKRIKRMRQATMSIGGEANTSNSSSCCIPGTLSALEWLRYETKMAPEQQQQPVLSTGCRALDQAIALPLEYQNVSTRMMPPLVHHTAKNTLGIPMGHVTQFSGPTGSGKTQLALHVAARASQPPSALYRTWYLASNCRALASRLAELCQNNDTILERTIFYTTTNEFELLKHLAQLEAELIHVTKQQQQQQQQQPILLILDSCSACLASSETQLLGRVSLTLRRLTRQYSKNLAVILLNGTVANRRGEQDESLSSSSSSYRKVKPALGRPWGETADIHVWLEPDQQEQHQHQPSVGCTESSSSTTTNHGSAVKIRAVVDRHRTQRRSTGTQSSVCWFRLTALGIQDIPTSR